MTVSFSKKKAYGHFFLVYWHPFMIGQSSAATPTMQRLSVMAQELCLTPITTTDVKADVITSRLRIGRPGKTNSKEQNFIHADQQTPTKLRQDQVILSPINKRRLSNASGRCAGSSQSRLRGN